MTDASSPATPYRPYPSSITMQREVFLADSTSVRSSSGPESATSITERRIYLELNGTSLTSAGHDHLRA